MTPSDLKLHLDKMDHHLYHPDPFIPIIVTVIQSGVDLDSISISQLITESYGC